MNRISKNSKILDPYKGVGNIAYSFAYLIAEAVGNQEVKKDPKEAKKPLGVRPIYEFLYNPEAILKSVSIQYQQASIPYLGVLPVIYGGGGNQVTSFSGLYLDSRDEGKSLQPIIDQLIKLREPTQQNNLLKQPTRVYFKWGANRSPLSVVTDIQVQETSWLNGFPVRATIGFSLLEVKSNIALSQSNAQKIKETITNKESQGLLPKALSEKQLIDGAKAARKFMNENPTFYSVDVRRLIKDAKSLTLLNKENGETFISANGIEFLTGKYNGHKFTPIRI